jgi:hypothetical protein
MEQVAPASYGCAIDKTTSEKIKAARSFIATSIVRGEYADCLFVEI